MKDYYNINDFIISAPKPTKHVKTTVSLYTFLFSGYCNRYLISVNHFRVLHVIVKLFKNFPKYVIQC